MSEAPTPDPAKLDDDACQRALAILVDIGISIGQELKVAAKDVAVVARANAFDRVALAVRRTIILSKHIAKTSRPAVNAETTRTLARKHVIRAVEEAIDTKADPAEAPALRVELLERMDAPEFIDDLAHRTPGDLIMELCRDLGLANIPGMRRFPRRTPDDIAILCAQAAAPPGSGLPQWLAAAAPQAAKNDGAPPPRSQPDERRHL